MGCFLGLGASGGPMEELLAILKASIVAGKVDTARFCREGLASAHPLLAFHLLSNYILCHGSIAAGLGGPNRAFYSRGTGTVTALAEACWALAEDDCTRALAGGADSALHLASFEELHLEGFTANGFVPGEGAALLALSTEAERPLAWIEACAVDRDLAVVLDRLKGPAPDLIIQAPWGPSARDAIASAVHTVDSICFIDLFAALADPLAAGPALACAAAVDLLVSGKAHQALVLCAGVDGAFGGVRLSCGRPA
ncbi:MAG: beta-ketoacyl synthase N-terminal-like domain-containing protein [Myxococcales bacterium]